MMPLAVSEAKIGIVSGVVPGGMMVAEIMPLMPSIPADVANRASALAGTGMIVVAADLDMPWVAGVPLVIQGIPVRFVHRPCMFAPILPERVVVRPRPVGAGNGGRGRAGWLVAVLTGEPGAAGIADGPVVALVSQVAGYVIAIVFRCACAGGLRRAGLRLGESRQGNGAAEDDGDECSAQHVGLLG